MFCFVGVYFFYVIFTCLYSLRREMFVFFICDSGKKVKLLEFFFILFGMMSFKFKNLGILFWFWRKNSALYWSVKL